MAMCLPPTLSGSHWSPLRAWIQTPLTTARTRCRGYGLKTSLMFSCGVQDLSGVAEFPLRVLDILSGARLSWEPQTRGTFLKSWLAVSAVCTDTISKLVSWSGLTSLLNLRPDCKRKRCSSCQFLEWRLSTWVFGWSDGCSPNFKTANWWKYILFTECCK